MSKIKFIDKYPGEVVRALSIKQPYASLMLHGKIETRTWNSKYTGWVLICASKQPYYPSEVLEISGRVQYDRMESLLGNNWMFPKGKAIAIGRLYNSRRLTDFSFPMAMPKEGETKPSYSDIVSERCFVKYDPDLYGHSYTDVQAIEPFDWKGKLGWSTLDEETKSKIILL